MGWIPVDCYLEVFPLINPQRRVSRSNGPKGRATFQIVVGWSAYSLDWGAMWVAGCPWQAASGS